MPTCKCYIVYDWKNNEAKRVNSTKNGSTGPHEVLVPVDINADVPEINVEKMAAEINVDEGDIRATLGDELVDEPEERLSTETDPIEVVFQLDIDNYRDQLKDIVAEASEDRVVDETIEWWRTLISTEHREMNRPQVLEYMEEKLDDLKEMRDG